jgi:integrase/recombinase XerD
MLRSFVAFAVKRKDRYICAATAVAWSAQAAAQMRRHKRLRLVTRFAEYLRAEDPRHEIPPQDVFHPHAHRPSPHIFSDEDIKHIVGGAAQLGSPGSLQGKMYSTLFGLIATTGLRFSEAACLRLSDLTPDGLIIRQTKFRKNRLVPLHPTTWAALERYLVGRRRVSTDDFVFITQRHTRPSHGAALSAFRAVCDRAGIGRSQSGARPRIHDLRHTFAVRALERSPVGRDRVERHIVALTTYLGHARIESTYWYLERTPRLLKDIAEACEAVVAGTQP